MDDVVPLGNGHVGAVLCGCLDSDRALLFTGSKDRTVKCWDISVGCRDVCVTGMLSVSVRRPALL